MKNKQASHVKKNEMVVFTNQTSGKQTDYKVQDVQYNPGDYPTLPVRITVCTEYNDKGKVSGTAIVGFRENEQVLVA